MAFDKAIFKSKIRLYMKDSFEKNRLLGGEYEADDPLIELCTELAIGEFSMAPPMSLELYTADSFSDEGAVAILMDAVVAKLLTSDSFLQYRNQLSYSDGGESLAVSDKGDPYTRLAQMLMQSFLMKANNVKKTINYCQAWGGVTSPYARYIYYNLGG